MTLGERVKAIGDSYAEGNLTRLSVILGYPRANLSNVANDTTIPKIDFVIAFMRNMPEVNIKWLLLGEGQMFTQEAGDKEEPDLDHTHFTKIMAKLEEMQKQLKELERDE